MVAKSNRTRNKYWNAQDVWVCNCWWKPKESIHILFVTIFMLCYRFCGSVTVRSCFVEKKKLRITNLHNFFPSAVYFVYIFFHSFAPYGLYCKCILDIFFHISFIFRLPFTTFFFFIHLNVFYASHSIFRDWIFRFLISNNRNGREKMWRKKPHNWIKASWDFFFFPLLQLISTYFYFLLPSFHISTIEFNINLTVDCD